MIRQAILHIQPFTFTRVVRSCLFRPLSVQLINIPQGKRRWHVNPQVVQQLRGDVLSEKTDTFYRKSIQQHMGETGEYTVVMSDLINCVCLYLIFICTIFEFVNILFNCLLK